MRINVRRATASDLPTIVRFNEAMALETEGLQLDRNVLREGVAGVLGAPSRGYYLLAETDGRLAGQTLITFEWSDWRNGNFWWIQSVYVDPSYRRRGIYTSLHNHVLEQARASTDVRGVRLYVERENHDARRVYEKLGMGRAAYDMYEIDFVLGGRTNGLS